MLLNGMECNTVLIGILHLQLSVYGPGRVDPSSLQVLRPALQYSVHVTIPPELLYGRLILVMAKGFCTDAAGHHFIRTANSTFTLRFGTYTYTRYTFICFACLLVLVLFMIDRDWMYCRQTERLDEHRQQHP